MSAAQTRTAVALLSGGLDSQLAVQMMLDQGIHVVGLHLYTGFCITEHKRRLGAPGKDGAVRRNPVFDVADQLGIPLELRDISETYLKIITHPKHGTGSGVNPCRDCRIHMFEKAFEYMEEISADFIVSGEVLGQRPMSQVRTNLEFIHRRIPDPDKVLLPLSAKFLEPSLPEREGWVNREELGTISGRSRKDQFRMAKEFNISDFETPAGGCCFLTDENYARKFKDLFKFEPDKTLSMEDVVLLGVGRHFRLSDNCKVIVGRDENENRVLERHAGTSALLAPPETIAGPTALLIGEPNQDAVTLACGLVVRYGDYPAGLGPVIVKTKEQDTTVHVMPVDLAGIENKRI